MFNVYVLSLICLYDLEVSKKFEIIEYIILNVSVNIKLVIVYCVIITKILEII